MLFLTFPTAPTADRLSWLGGGRLHAIGAFAFASALWTYPGYRNKAPYEGVSALY